MAEYLGPILIPDNLPSGIFPIRVRYGRTSSIAPTLAVHRFGHGDAAAEQRFILGDGATRYSFPFPKLTASEKVSLQSFYDQQQGSLIPFTVNVTMPDATVEAKVCRFDGALAITQTSNVTWSATVAMVEVPQSTPAYAITKTLTRFPDSSLLTSLLGATQEMIPLLVINGNVFCSNRRCTVGGQLYQPRLADWGDVTQSIDGSADQFTFSLGNADRVISQLSRSINLYGASVQFSHFHVNTGTLLNLWSGEINDFTCSASPVATFASGDPLWDLRKAYPVLTIDRKKGFDIPDQPVTVHSGGWAINSTSIPNDTAYGDPVPDVWCNDAKHPLPVPCTILAGRDESQYYAALGVVGRGPISGYYSGTDKQHLLDGQPHHGAGDPDISKRSFGLRRAYGGTPYTGDEASANNQPDPGSNSFSLDEVGKALLVHPLDSVAFLQIRRTDASGIQPVAVNTHTMVAQINAGLGGWVWSAPGAKTWQTGIINPIWAGINSYLVWKSATFASVAPGGLSDNLKSSYWYRTSTAATLEAWFDCAKAIADAAICGTIVASLFPRKEQVWVPSPIVPPSFPPPDGWSSGGGVWTYPDITTEQQFTFQGVVGGDGNGAARPLRDVLRDIFGACLGGFNFNFGKLRTFLRYSASVTDAFTIGNTLYQSYSESSRKPAFTRLEASFSDADYSYQNNVMGYEDLDILAVLGMRKATANLFGTTNKSQAARITTVRAREEMGGVGTADVLNARIHNLKTTVLALSVEPGRVISYTGPETNGATVKFRVTKWTLGKDFSVSIQGTTVNADMYDLTTGPKPADVPPSAVPDRGGVGVRPADVLPIGGQPFTMSVTGDGSAINLNGNYCPPMPVGNFAGVTIYYACSTAPTVYYPAGDCDYDGDPNSITSTVFGTWRARLPISGDASTTWTVWLVPRTRALRGVLDPINTPHMLVAAVPPAIAASLLVATQTIEGITPGAPAIGSAAKIMQSVKWDFDVTLAPDPNRGGEWIEHSVWNSSFSVQNVADARGDGWNLSDPGWGRMVYGIPPSGTSHSSSKWMPLGVLNCEVYRATGLDTHGNPTQKPAIPVFTMVSVSGAVLTRVSGAVVTSWAAGNALVLNGVPVTVLSVNGGAGTATLTAAPVIAALGGASIAGNLPLHAQGPIVMMVTPAGTAAISGVDITPGTIDLTKVDFSSVDAVLGVFAGLFGIAPGSIDTSKINFIDFAKITNVIVTNAMIQNLAVGKLTGGSVSLSTLVVNTSGGGYLSLNGSLVSLGSSLAGVGFSGGAASIAGSSSTTVGQVGGTTIFNGDISFANAGFTNAADMRSKLGMGSVLSDIASLQSQITAMKTVFNAHNHSGNYSSLNVRDAAGTGTTAVNSWGFSGNTNTQGPNSSM